jgi:hypothetical protein
MPDEAQSCIRDLQITSRAERAAIGERIFTAGLHALDVYRRRPHIALVPGGVNNQDAAISRKPQRAIAQFGRQGKNVVAEIAAAFRRSRAVEQFRADFTAAALGDRGKGAL